MTTRTSPSARRAGLVLALLLAPALLATPAHAGVVTMRPIADTQLGGHAGRLGHAKVLRAAAHPTRRVVLRFNARRLSGTVMRAGLRIRVSAARRATLVVRPVRRRGRWSERTRSAHGAPRLGRPLARARAEKRKWVTLDVTRAVRRGIIELALGSSSRRGVEVRSREARARPRLRIVTSTTAAAPGAAPGPPAPAPAPARPRRVLPPASVFLAPNGSDGNPCTREAPCATMDRGYRVAAPGQVVELAGGDYPRQTIGADPAKASPDAVWFTSAPGVTATMQDLFLDGASNLGFFSLAVRDEIRVHNDDPGVLGSHDVTFDTLSAQMFSFKGRVARLSILGGSYGNTVDNQPQIGNPGDQGDARPHEILIDGAYLHDFMRSAPDVHTECLQVMSVDTLTIRNSRFDNCDGTGDIGITDGPHDNITLENNFLGKAGDAYFAVQMTRNQHNLVLRNNSASKGVIFSDSDSGGPYLLEGNYMPYNGSTCTGGATYRNNVFAGGTCGPSDVEVGALRFVDEDHFDLHLAPDSEAIDRGTTTDYPTADIDGQSRPMGAAPDAGADERR